MSLFKIDSTSENIGEHHFLQQLSIAPIYTVFSVSKVLSPHLKCFRCKGRRTEVDYGLASLHSYGIEFF